MKIALFHNLPSGGAKRALHGLVRGLSRRGACIDVFVPATADEDFLGLAPVARTVSVHDVRPTVRGLVRSAIRYLPPVGPLGVSLGDLEETQRRIARLIDIGGYDVALVEQDQFTMAPFILKSLSTPTVYYCQQPSRSREAVHRAAAAGTDSPWWLRTTRALRSAYAVARLTRIDRTNVAGARTILTNSRFSREAIRRAYGLPATVCYLGIDTDLFVPRGLPRDDAVLSVGFLGALKGHDFIVRALARIDPARRPTLVIVANGSDEPWRRYVADLAATLGVKLEVRVGVDDTTLVGLYNASKLFVYAPHREPFGLAPLEAMACGTPVVTVDEGGVRETVVNGDTGLLTDRDEASFADAVAGLLADDARRARMSSRAGAAARDFWSLESATDRLQNHLAGAVTAGR